MVNRVRQLQKHGVITLLTLVSIGMNMGCEDRIDSPAANTSEGEPVEVTMNIDLANEVDGASLYPNASTKADKAEAFSAQLVPAARTKATNKPTYLYNLEIRQYDTTTGDCLNGTSFASTTAIGSSFTVTLNAVEQCRLVIIARGKDNTVPQLGNKPFSDVQAVLAKAETIKSISTDDTDMNNMPYILYLPNVKVSTEGKLQSPDGTDIRLRLKRLATKLTLNWTISDKMKGDKYKLKEVRLFQVPAGYRILPEPENTKWGTVYPNSVSEFVDGFRLKDDALTSAKGTYTLWMPANAQGSSSAITYPNLRSKKNVNPTTTYAEFIVDNQEKKERFYYRVYLGGNITTDFNLFENTDYNWTVNIYSASYTSDDRISLLDQTPVISTNLQPTANCFMMRPGTNICFNPYKHTSGANGWNTALTTGTMPGADKKIVSVEVLWQNKDAGTSGDLVLGYAASNDASSPNHSNLVNFVDNTDIEKVRVHVKVPVTNGGNAVLAAKNSSGDIVWSWHLWISDYVPGKLNASSISNDKSRQSAINAALNATEGGAVHTYPGAAWEQSSGIFYKKVIMDRNLGALRATYSLTNALEAARTYGNLYQWGRKDPLPGSVDGSIREIDVIFNADGVSFSMSKNSGGNLENSIKHPIIFYKNMFLDDNSWGPDTKSIYDPCPNGWRVPDFTSESTKNISAGIKIGDGDDANFKYLIHGNWYNTFFDDQTITTALFSVSNGYLYNGSIWFPALRLREAGSGDLRDIGSNVGYLPSYCSFSTRTVANKAGYVWALEFKMNSFTREPFSFGAIKPYAFSVRCVTDE